MIPPDFIDDLLTRTDIVEIIDARVSLKKTGQNHTGLCPFHTEKSPSFSVNADKQFYYCFGCQASGSAIKFVMEFDRLDFIPAIEMLAARVGMEIPQDRNAGSNEKQQKRKSIYETLRLSSEFYTDQLRHHSQKEVAVTYLKSRGLTGQIAKKFQIGFAPAGWDNLYGKLALTNEERRLLIDSGMVIEKAEEDKIYDRFRERIMFPIRDLRGRVIAFGGRIMGDGKPKYLNSPETPVFHKGRELYGLYEARQSNRKLAQLLVVEGYMDVVALAQNGVNYAVATLGTATTEDHLDRMYRMVSKIIFCFDGDIAGKNAAWKALNVTLLHMKDGRSAKFLFVPDGEDPDSLIRKEGEDKFKWRLDKAKSLADFFFEKLQEEVDVETIEGKAHLSKLAMPLLMKIPVGVFRELMIDQLAILTNLTSEKLLSLSGVDLTKPQLIERKIIVQRPEEYSNFPPDFPAENFDRGEVDYYGNEDDDYYPGQQSEVSSELANKAIAFILSQPELAYQLEDTDIQIFETGRGCALLLDVVRTILAEEIRSPVFLLVKYQSRPEFALLKQLAELEQLLGVSDVPAEFVGVIRALHAQISKNSDKELKRGLLAKPFSTLSESEKQQLRALIQKLK
ncbi:MAG: DNA primase [Flavobacterium sp.]